MIVASRAFVAIRANGFVQAKRARRRCSALVIPTTLTKESNSMHAPFASRSPDPRPRWRPLPTLLGLVTVLALSACGGGGNNGGVFAPVTGGGTTPGASAGAGNPADPAAPAPDSAAKPELRCAP